MGANFMKLQNRIRERARMDELLCGIAFLLAALLMIANGGLLRFLAIIMIFTGVFFMLQAPQSGTTEAHKKIREEVMEARSNAMSTMNVIVIGILVAGVVVSIISQGPRVPYFKITMICFLIYLGLEHLLTGLSISKRKEKRPTWQY